MNLFVIHLRQGKKHEKKENVVGDHDDDDLRVYLVHNLLCTKWLGCSAFDLHKECLNHVFLFLLLSREVLFIFPSF